MRSQRRLGVWAFGRVGVWAFGRVAAGAWLGAIFLFRSGDLFGKSFLAIHSQIYHMEQTSKGLAKMARTRSEAYACLYYKLGKSASNNIFYFYLQTPSFEWIQTMRLTRITF